MSASKLLCSFILIGGGIYLSLPLFDHGPILIQSLESKTVENKPVYNQISLQSTDKKDVWMMNQSHHGLKADQKKWDRLAIIVNKETNPNEVTFLQLPPGKLEWNDDLLKKKVEYKVSCFMCHSNGPRVIRPDEKEVKVSFSKKVKIAMWNLKIKTYGAMKESKVQVLFDKTSVVPFRYPYSLDNEKLELKSCTKCHNGGSDLFSRNQLTRQNIIAIKFMVENKMMPPLGFSVSEHDRKELNKFIKGF